MNFFLNKTGEIGRKNYFFPLSSYLKTAFSGKVRKVSLDVGFSCPNRKGKEREGGCFWCDPQGSGSGNVPELWHKKLEEETDKLIQKNYKGSIAYFQSFTNTYGDLDKLKELYTKALETRGVLGLAIGTRPDCLGDDVLELLAYINKNHFLWVEVGMQTMYDETLEKCNRGHRHSQTVEAINKLKNLGIKTVVHLIIGLPFETKEMMVNSFKECARLNPWGVKLHPLHIVKGSVFEKWFYEGKIKLLELKEYANLTATFLEMVSPEMVIHRLTGERPEGILIAPGWCLEKEKVREEIIKTLEERNSFQGKMFKENYG
jgi:radical SAM protein (TIGR01212 family)